MGSLAGQYISQSYQSLVKLGNDSTISSSYTDLQDGLGNSLNISVNAQGDISASGNIFAANLGTLTYDTGSLLTTASVNVNVLTFTKGNGSTFNLSVTSSVPAGTVSGSSQIAALGFATTGSNVFVGNQTINGNLNVTGSFTASGLIYPLVDNGEKSFMQTDGNGNLSFQYVDTIWEAFYAGESVPKGTPLYFSGSVGANPIARAADAADPNKMPVVLIAGDNLTAGNTYEGIVLGLIEGLNLTGYVAGQTVYVAEGGGWSTNLPSGSNSITQVLGVVTKGGNGGKGLVLNPGPAQLPGLQTGYVWVGNGTNQPVAVATSSFAGGGSGSINTASFATTGSNSFVGDQTISGSLIVSGSANNDIEVYGNIRVYTDTVNTFDGASVFGNIYVGGGNIGLNENYSITWTNGPRIDTASTNMLITGSVFMNETLTLAQLDTLPAGQIGMLAVSASHLWFYNGAWTQLD